MFHRNPPAPVPAMPDLARRDPMVNVDPDFFVPACGDRGNRYLRAVRLLFPRAT